MNLGLALALASIAVGLFYLLGGILVDVEGDTRIFRGAGIVVPIVSVVLGAIGLVATLR